MEETKIMKKYKGILIPILVMLVVAAVLDYLLLPAWNLQAGPFWTYIIVILLSGYLAGFPLRASKGAGSGSGQNNGERNGVTDRQETEKSSKYR